MNPVHPVSFLICVFLIRKRYTCWLDTDKKITIIYGYFGLLNTISWTSTLKYIQVQTAAPQYGPAPVPGAWGPYNMQLAQGPR